MPGFLKIVLSGRVVALVVILWLVVCLGFQVTDMFLTATRVQRWMMDEGITEADIVDVEAMREVTMRSQEESLGGALIVDPRDYVIDNKLYHELAMVVTSPHEILFLWNYQRSDYQEPVAYALTVVTILALITKELIDARR